MNNRMKRLLPVCGRKGYGGFMKLMIASDIHGSSYYCAKLMNAYNAEQAERLVLLGDLLYHGPRNDLPRDYAPKKVIAMLNEVKDDILCVRGNCEAEVDQMVLKFPVLADYMTIFLDHHMIFATHGHLYHEKHMPPMKNGDIFLYGHTHIPELRRTNRYIFINPGSVSLPKKNSSSSYILLENNTIFLKSIDGEILDQFIL